jgi:hypothetical protein
MADLWMRVVLMDDATTTTTTTEVDVHPKTTVTTFNKTKSETSPLPSQSPALTTTATAAQCLVDNDAALESPRNTPPFGRCAINLFGLPRAFQSLVLPSLIQNFIRPNAAHNCDYFVHYFNLTQEAAGKSGKGGHLNTSEILLLEEHVQREAPPGQRRPHVAFLVEQEEDFWKTYEALINKTHVTRDDKGRYLYYPWKAGQTYIYPATVDNIIKMWHSIQSSWLLMERHATGHNVQYNRVAMLRADVMYSFSLPILFRCEWASGCRLCTSSWK